METQNNRTDEQVRLKIRSRPEWDDVWIDAKHEKTLREFGWREAGYGYIMACVKKQWKNIILTKLVYLHRLVWFLEKGEWPEMLDHINGEKHDNRLSNLRPVSGSVNQKNQKQRDGTISGKQGVKWNYNGWQAYIIISKEGKVHSICSSTTKDKYIAELAQDCLRYMQGEYIDYHHPEFTFEDKWEWIGEKQREQILHSFRKNGIETTLETGILPYEGRKDSIKKGII
jgi:hypothetical protein